MYIIQGVGLYVHYTGCRVVCTSYRVYGCMYIIQGVGLYVHHTGCRAVCTFYRV